MIIFTSNIKLIDYIEKPVNIYNLSSLYSGFNNMTCFINHAMNILSPCNSGNNIFQTGIDINYINSPEFDNMFAAHIINTPELFNYMVQLMLDVNNGINSIVLIYHDDFRDSITESIIKFIQMRYGYNAWMIDDFDDLQIIKESYLTPLGLLTLDNDILIFNQMLSNQVIPDQHNLLKCNME